jgi:hypothetical protein
MPRSASDFAYLDTGSAPKLRMIDQQIAMVKKRFSPADLTGYCVGIPGAGLQAARHRDEYCNYGIPEERQIMVDYDETVHQTQKEHMSKLNYKGQIVLDELGHALDGLYARKKIVSIVDYDDVSFLLPRHEVAIQSASANDVKVIVLVITNRCNKLTAYHEQWKKTFNLRKRFVSPSKGWREPVGEIQRRAVESIGKKAGYDVISTPYPGRDLGPPMLSCVMLRK